MVRLFILLAAAALVLLILALISGLSAERLRNAPRAVWILLIVLLPIAGPIAYLLWGRPVSRRPPRRPSSPDDDPEFLRSVDSSMKNPTAGSTDRDQARRDRELLADLERELHQDDEKP
ncbi:PLD nuclease N-terminal domain-containing protein [Actinoplanes sp. NEAU-A12]|uniref:PLD nuclease N-terminal domain-containing protein n=1 Tax=Actinoplanes sandaracinus TaxID=3045177 RepID=A0ABT6WDD8_9ACTN|nr:PLD nuclease N-terminal domain-containing protein [Actinoplanes sandaracinus]MDI6097753.1 PLD nuclease N-terminal domain-containing protein [Actinoplanes sandaracinus]